MKALRDGGFSNVGIDLIYGLPGQTTSEWEDDLHRAVAAYAPEHLSCYQLTYAPGTPLTAALDAGEFEALSGEAERDLFLSTHRMLDGLGYEGYEVSNFARTPALRSRHNSAYWNHTDYLGFGPAAHSFIHPERSWNVKDCDAYCDALLEGRLPVEDSETLTASQLAAERIMLALRTRDGLDLRAFTREFAVDLRATRAETLARLEKDGLIRLRGDRLQPTLAGMAVADALAVELAPDAE